MRVGKWHKLGPESHVSIASLVERILALAMEIWNHVCGPFWPDFAVFGIVGHIGITISPWGMGSSDEQQAASVTANNNPGHGTKGDIKGYESRLGASISPRLPTLDGPPRRPI